MSTEFARARRRTGARAPDRRGLARRRGEETERPRARAKRRGERARIGANAVVTDDVPDGATMIGLKARSTLVPAEEWLREFIPYGTPCDEPCEEIGANGAGRMAELERQVADLRAELDQLRAGGGEPARRSGTDS